MLEQAYKFEQAVSEAFESAGFEPRKLQGQDEGFDFVLTLRNVSHYAVEVKYYRSEHPKSSLLKTSAVRLLRAAKSNNISKAILAVSCRVPEELREELEQDYQITIVDRIDLLVMTSGKAELNDRLRSLMEIEASTVPEEAVTTTERLNQSNKDTSTVETPEEDTTGKDLCNEIKAIGVGKKHWRKYEIKCIEILKYLFSSDLNGWHEQKKTHDDLNRYDLICRVSPVTEFWTFVIEDLRSRYIIFEFKNYREKIKQGQVLTTEKYLHTKALRSAAFIISRKGPDNNAFLTTQGSLREQGKVIINFTDEDLCKMLCMKSKGDDPADYMFEVVDNFLMGLPR